MAGVSRLQYVTDARFIRVMCSGRVDLRFALRAFANGHDGVFVGGCRLGECNYITHGNYQALGMVLLCQKILEHLGIDPERLRIEFMSAGDGILLTEMLNDFGKKVRQMGPLGKGEGLDEASLKSGLAAAEKLVPYIRLVERESLRIPVQSEQAYRRFFASEAFETVFREAILEKLTLSRIADLLREKPRSTGEISESLGLNPSEVSRHMNRSSRYGLVRFDVDSRRYALAC